MIKHFVYLPPVHIIVIFNQAAASFFSQMWLLLHGATSHLLLLFADGSSFLLTLPKPHDSRYQQKRSVKYVWLEECRTFKMIHLIILRWKTFWNLFEILYFVPNICLTTAPPEHLFELWRKLLIVGFLHSSRGPRGMWQMIRSSHGCRVKRKIRWIGDQPLVLHGTLLVCDLPSHGEISLSGQVITVNGSWVAAMLMAGQSLRESLSVWKSQGGACSYIFTFI